jgi:hypothetical protein
VTDNGSPRLSASRTFTVVVREVNTAPVLASIAAQQVLAGRRLGVTASATDADVPAQTLSYGLVSGAPAGMTVNAATGAIAWTPAASDAGAVHVVAVRVTDSGAPALSATREFAVAVQSNPDLAKETWSTQNFSDAQLADATISGDAADPNGNTRANLLEFALGAPATGAFDPLGYLRTAVAFDARDGRFHARLVYRQRKDDPALVFSPEVSAERATWSGGAGAVEEISRTSIDAQFDEVVVQDRTPATLGAPRYIRLRVTRN